MVYTLPDEKRATYKFLLLREISRANLTFGREAKRLMQAYGALLLRRANKKLVRSLPFSRGDEVGVLPLPWQAVLLCAEHNVEEDGLGNEKDMAATLGVKNPRRVRAYHRELLELAEKLHLPPSWAADLHQLLSTGEPGVELSGAELPEPQPEGSGVRPRWVPAKALKHARWVYKVVVEQKSWRVVAGEEQADPDTVRSAVLPIVRALGLDIPRLPRGRPRKPQNPSS